MSEEDLKNKILSLINERPGISLFELAEILKVDVEKIAEVCRQLLEEKKIFGIPYAKEIKRRTHHIVFGYQGNAKFVGIYIIDQNIQRTLKASFIYTYNGRNFINAAGGRSVPLSRLTFLDPKEAREIQRYFEG